MRIPGARYIPSTEIEIVHDDVALGAFKHGLFDFDGTISILREGWQEVMAPLMVEMICGEHEPTLQIEEAVKEYIDDSTGIQTILQMERLAEMVKEYGLVPEDQILDAQGYKSIYNGRLMKSVDERLGQLERGEKQSEDFTLRGALAFVKMLYERGITLYLASGTDRGYVEHESRVVGAAPYFKGGIFGALRTFQEYSKDKVIKEILKDYNLHGSELFVVGDGPVEIRNAKDNGALAIGVASDEVAGHGLNAHKRERLIRAGSDIIIPDFGDGEELVGYLFGENDG